MSLVLTNVFSGIPGPRQVQPPQPLCPLWSASRLPAQTEKGRPCPGAPSCCWCPGGPSHHPPPPCDLLFPSARVWLVPHFPGLIRKSDLKSTDQASIHMYVYFRNFFCIYLITYSLNLLGVRPPSQSLQLPFTGLEPYVRLNTALLYFQSMVCKVSIDCER